jgi:hypothetical protein
MTPKQYQRHKAREFVFDEKTPTRYSLNPKKIVEK